MRLPCQAVFTYKSAPSLSTSGALDEVRVSSSTKFIVGAVRVTSDTSPSDPLLLQTYGMSTKEKFLLVEIVLFAKNKLKVLENRYTEDVMVVEGVIYSNPNGELPYNQVLSSGSRRRLSDVASMIVEENKQAGLSTNVYITRVWNLKWPAGTTHRRSAHRPQVRPS